VSVNVACIPILSARLGSKDLAHPRVGKLPSGGISKRSHSPFEEALDVMPDPSETGAQAEACQDEPAYPLADGFPYPVDRAPCDVEGREEDVA
jgi:hypothetical protein